MKTWRIMEGENGYMVHEDGPEMRYHLQKFWVAATVEDLARLMTALAVTAKTGRLPESQSRP
jgi:hypothetical protein